ncbi:MAG: hypothetical protein SFV55_19785 [Haliscomenobacter sp.]|uniref:hypothetical protein n=1 Tax=Haliscomenobacter sp. TaxID=2717303 RepID=UPI0029B5EB90|nr:hypothetical protein [Haliscomenobacter sp.]MDX2070679.1 hypothetical protein [Haliscomenobacter sp.]
MKTHKIMALITAMTLFQTLSGQSSSEDHYVGTFSNSQSGLVLSMDKAADGSYKGFFQLQGQQYTFSNGVKLLGMINAEYQYNGQAFAFSLSRLLGEYYVTSEGVSIPVVKTANQAVAATKSTVGAGNTPKSSTATSPTTSNVTGGKATTTAPAATGARISDPYSGYSFQTPAAWKSQEQGGGFVLNKVGTQVSMSVSPHEYKTLAEMRAQVLDANDPASNTYLKAQTQAYGSNGLLIRFDGTAQGQAVVIEMISLLSPNGGGVTVAASGAKDQFGAEYTSLVKSVANSVQFSKPQTSSLAEQWKQKIKGKRLDYYYTGNGMADHYIIHICSEGTFVYKNDNSYSSNNAYTDFSYASAGADAGKWQVVAKGTQPTLILRFNDGRVWEYPMSPGKAGNEILLNGKRYFVQAGTMCQ